MKIFCDFHHGALARSMIYLFADRLNHKLAFPSAECVAWPEMGKQWNLYSEPWAAQLPLTRGEIRNVSYASFNEISDGAFDVMVLTRKETAGILASLGHPKKGVTYIGVAGNEGTVYPNWVMNYILTDSVTAGLLPDVVGRVHIAQELGRNFAARGFVPIVRGSQFVSTFINAYSDWGKAFTETFLPTRKKLSDAGLSLALFGHGNSLVGGCNIPEGVLPDMYHMSLMTMHYKPAEGFGHSLLQSIPCGRPVIVPPEFVTTRESRHYLREGVNCVVAPWDPDAIADKITETCADEIKLNEFCRAAYESYFNVFHYESDATAVQGLLSSARSHE